MKQAEGWYRKAVYTGETGAMDRLARLFDKEGRPDLAEQWYRKAAAAGDTAAAGAMYKPGHLLEAHGSTDQTEHW